MGNNWITLKKGIEVLVFGGIGFVISWASGLPPTETVIACVAILKVLENYIKHRND